ncbi:MAG: hypothetical protein AMXMBFR34_11960 [Myxococcaceae bacterium]
MSPFLALSFIVPSGVGLLLLAGVSLRVERGGFALGMALPLFIFGAFLLGVGLLLRFAVHADWARGLGPALVLAGAMGLVIDGFAERRAEPYTEALEVLAKENGVAPP